jgi:hypothetical protein
MQPKAVRKRAQYARDPERFKALSATFRAEHPAQIRASSIRYCENNRSGISERGRQTRLVLRIEAFRVYGDGICALCGEPRHEFLCLDHIHNNGAEERRVLGGGVHLYRYLKKLNWPKGDYRVLCHNCNMSKMLRERMAVIPKSLSQSNYARRSKQAVIDAYGGKCVCCGESDPILLVLDHPNGNGQVDRALNGKGKALYARLKRLGFPKEGYRLLCHNCNMSIGFFGYCPHTHNIVDV